MGVGPSIATALGMGAGGKKAKKAVTGVWDDISGKTAREEAERKTLRQATKGVSAIDEWTEGLGPEQLKKIQGFLTQGFDKGIAAASGLGESRRRDISERGEARRGGIEQDLVSRGISGSSMGTQAQALAGQVESAELDNLANSLAQTFSGLEIGKGTALAGSQQQFSSQLFSAQQQIAGIHSGISYQPPQGSMLDAGVQLGSAALMGGACCFIMLEGRYGDGTMDKVVRRFRDEHMTERNRRGYYKVAEVLVPLMRRSKVVHWLARKTICDPLVSYGKWFYGENRHGWVFAPVKAAWLWVFDTAGGETEFLRENGETV